MAEVNKEYIENEITHLKNQLMQQTQTRDTAANNVVMIQGAIQAYQVVLSRLDASEDVPAKELNGAGINESKRNNKAPRS